MAISPVGNIDNNLADDLDDPSGLTLEVSPIEEEVLSKIKKFWEE